jgi:hypothetical protein
MLVDFVKESVGTGGATNLALGGAVSGFQSFDNGPGQDVRFPYGIIDGDAWEVGIGYIDSTTNFERETFHDSSTGSQLTVTTAAEVMLTENEATAWEGSSPASGALIANPNVTEINASSGLGATNIIYSPFTLLYPAYYDGFAFNVTSAGDNAYIGLYDVKDGLPVNLLAKHDSASIDVSGTGLKQPSFDGGSIWLNAGQYFIGIQSDADISLTATQNDSVGCSILGASTTMGIDSYLWKDRDPYATMPDPADVTSLASPATVSFVFMLEAT